MRHSVEQTCRLKVKRFLPFCFSAFLLFIACTDKVQFGDAFLEKAPGGTVSADTVFTNAEYTRQFLAGIQPAVQVDQRLAAVLELLEGNA